MPRDAQSLKIGNTPWADGGDRTDPDDASLTPALTRREGWDATFSGPGGNLIRRRVVNQLFREIYGMLIEINRHGGILEWDAAISYQHTAIVLGSDGTAYISKQDSLNVNPVTDGDESHWQPFIDVSVGSASTTAEGTVELAIRAEINAGTPSGRAVTNDQLKGSRYRQNYISTSAPTSSDGADGDTWDRY